MPRLPRPTGAAAVAVALGLLAAAPAAGQEPLVTEARVLAHLDPAAGQTPENIALGLDGSAYLTFASARQIAHVTDDGRVSTRATLPAVAHADTPLLHSAAVTGIARAHDGTLYVNYATGTSATGVWRLSPGDAPERIAALPADGLPNGLALDERRGVLYVADSVRGTVWRVPRSGGTATAWAKGAALAPLPAAPARGLGANGVRLRRDAVWVSNTDRGTLLRIPVRADGAAGPVEPRADGLAGIDDFTFPGPGRSVLAALNTGNRVVLVRADGTVTTVLTAREGLSNPTSVAVRGRTVYVPSAASATRRDPNLLVARLRHLIGRG
ncbi:SMP-30/gluconolactonase/LRE family protein [Streptomyces sp. NPDC001761]